MMPLEDPALKETLIRSYSNLRGLFEDLKVAKDRQSNVGESPYRLRELKPMSLCASLLAKLSTAVESTFAF